MLHVRLLLIRGCLGSFVISCVAASSTADERPVRFNRDVRSVLTDKCYACHGPDAETLEGGLRLDLRDQAMAVDAIVPGDPDASELVRRIFAEDSDERMPPPDSHKELTPDDRNLLRRWIAEGAPYEPHWSYTSLCRTDMPQFTDKKANVIDRFVDARLAEENLEPAPEADRVTLIRRLSFDLTGMPPSLDEVDAFVNDRSPRAYEQLVDRLLASPRYGERMAIYWLDLVRYADTVGYHGDQNVSQWLYRDYVIQAFNDNMPYDRFVQEQLAGDLLPNTTIDQRIASGYNRLNQTTEEGGAQAKEYLAIYFADRVRNVSQVFLGATMGCAQCHDHKFDPYTTRDFYSLGAFFADLDERGVYSARSRPPTIRVPDDEIKQKLAKLDKQIGQWNAEKLQLREELLSQQRDWEDETLRRIDDVHDITSVWVNDQQDAGWIESDAIPAEVAEALRVSPPDRTSQQDTAVRDYYLANAVAIVAIDKQIADATSTRNAIEQQAPETVVSRSVEPRTIRILPRGNWMDDSGEVVTPAIPAFLGTLETGDRRPTRLDLANWLCEDDNPLTSRTMVNRLWSLLFGRGICASVDDLGGQGTFPSYPDLLDALAVQFVDSGWDVKQMIRTIVTSATYRRSSRPTSTLQQRDSFNDLFARQGRFRIDAEMVRDTALATSGLLVEQVGGASVHPYQPAGYYAQLNFPVREYESDQGENQYRRGVYTHWQRTFLHPMLKAFDAPSREECTASRSRSNTPLQALTLLNDPTFVEAARVFAERIMREGGANSEERMAWAYRTAVSHRPPPAILDEMRRVYEEHLKDYQTDVEAARQLTSEGHAPIATLDPAELAAWTSVARVVLNLHETYTRY